MTMGLVDGKVALVTGAAGGIGGASAKLFAAEGAKVMVVDIDGEGAEEVAAAIRKDGGEAVGRRVDVADEAAVEAMVAAVVDLWGRVDCAHNNAGISDRKSGMTQLALADWQRMIDVNLTSVFLCLKHELRQMVDQGGGAIVNTSSGAGIVGYPPLPHYVAAKHGVLGLTKCAAQEFVRQGIRVNAVLPGLIETPMLRDSMATEELAEALRASVPRGTLGQPEEVAQAVVWLCSDRASFVSGESMLVDGASVCR
jgi:NAD(P)-dependent dehydrogenase (short-subunit alcohol dehydrogenase family)